MSFGDNSSLGSCTSRGGIVLRMAEGIRRGLRLLVGLGWRVIYLLLSRRE
jgi:hypothetical protein